MRDESALPATSYAVLGLLSFGRELSGYELKKWADHSLRFFYWSPALSNIYTELRRLEARGYVEARTVAKDELRNKRQFAITPAGRAALAAWVEGQAPAPLVTKDQLLLKVWAGHIVERERLTELVAAEERVAAETVEAVRYSLRRADRFGYSDLVERFCLRMSEARLAALAELREGLAAGGARGGAGDARAAEDAETAEGAGAGGNAEARSAD
ncbi:MAG TPA: helix-turn-helix transcriptional regulator [Acidimicrobiales bacterium]